jgi:uncharacterized YccA/Bax inhibitor family protein
MMRTANPALNKNTFAGERALAAEERMTINGTVHKTGFLLVLALVPAMFVWSRFFAGAGPEGVMPFMLIGVIGGLIAAMVTIFKRTWAPVTAPVYAALEGLFLGGISAVFEARFPGIVIQAIALTFGTLFFLLFAYRSGLIKATENFKLGVVAATGGIFFVYLISFVVGLFGVNVGFIHSSGLVGILFSLFVVVVAALNLVLDFDFIEHGAEAGAPKYLEWYAAFGLMVTLVWLYIEILRLLSKLQSRR